MLEGHDVASDKATLRASMLAKRKAVPPALYAQAQQCVSLLAEQVVTHIPYAGTLAGYAECHQEAPCLPLLLTCKQIRPDITLLLPRVAPSMKGNKLSFHPWQADMPMQQNCYGIAEPTAGTDLLPDVMIVPLVAATTTGARLGMGGGYYDCTLAAYTSRPVCMGLAYDWQCVDTLPMLPHDIWLDYMLWLRL